MQPSRLQIFGSVLKNKWRLLLGMSLLLLLFSLPLLLGLFSVQFLKPWAMEEFIATGTADGLSLFVLCAAWDAVGFAVGLLGSTVLCVGLSGVCQVLQLLVCQEGVVFTQDFARGVRENYKLFWTASLLVCFACFAAVLNWDFMQYSGENMALLTLSTVLVTVAGALLACSGIFVAAQSLQYRVGVWDAVKNGFFLTLAFFPQNLGMLLCIGIPMGAVLYLGIGAIAAFVLLMGVIGFCLSLMGVLLYCNGVFDRSINVALTPQDPVSGTDGPPEAL